MQLAIAGIDEVNTIRNVTGRDEVQKHLADLGFVVGAQVHVVSELGGILILSVKDSRLALDSVLAMHVMV